MIPDIAVTQETMENIDPNDTVILTDIIKTINEITLNQLVDSRDTNLEARTYSETTRTIVLNAYALKVVFALEIDGHVGAMNIHLITHLYETCYV